jgi:uncharacterized membrane protein YfcA
VPLWAWLVADLAVLLGALLQGSVGFGVNLVVVPVLLILDPDLVPGPALFAAFVLTGLVALRERGAIEGRNLALLIGAAVPGLLLGSLVLRLISEQGLAILIGAFVLLAVAVSVLGWRPSDKRYTALIAGGLAGFFGITAAIPGPPVALAYQGREGGTVRGMLGAFLLFLNPVALGLLAAVGRFGRSDMLAGGALVPGVVVGFLISSRTRHYLRGRRMRWAVLVVSTAAALALLVQAVG